MNIQNYKNSDMVTTRTINKTSVTSGPVYYEDPLEGVYVPTLSFPYLGNVLPLIGFIESGILGFLILMGALWIFIILRIKGKYKCPNCGKSYCWYKRVPVCCKRCGTKLGIPKIELPK